jgi:hypothetical protein
MGHVLFAICLALVVLGGFDWSRGSSTDPGRLWWIRVSPHRTVEVWRRGLSVHLVVTSRKGSVP